MEQQKLPEFISALQNTEAFDHPVKNVTLIQTHISYVLVAGEYVYKFKKPVDFGFLNFTSLDKRAHFCRQELTLNRRLCPDIYLDLVTVTRENDQFRLNGGGNIIEYGVKMKRMPEERMMGRMISNGQLKQHHLDGIIETLVPFYSKADGRETIRSFGKAESVGINVLENFDQTASFAGGDALDHGQFEVISCYAKEVLKDTARFDQRVTDGRIRDCHGDLYSANICLDTRVHIFDCIEFNERFRFSDVAADVAFLAMDLDYHGLSEYSDYFLTTFKEASNDADLLDHTGFYKCYRAYVRGKIGLFTAADPAVDKQTAKICTEQAKKYFTLAERYARDES
jgi:hypothetical protein